MAIGREFLFTIDLSPARLREGTSEVQQSLDHFELELPLIFRQQELFNILVSEIGIRHRELYNKGNLVREFDTGDLVVLMEQVNSRRKYGILHKLIFKTKVPYRFLEKATPISYWLQRLPFCEDLGRPGRKVKGSAARLENIPSTMVLHKHVYGVDTIFVAMAGPLAKIL